MYNDNKYLQFKRPWQFFDPQEHVIFYVSVSKL